MKRAFTLIELMVCCACIAILAAILFPVFGAARESARQSACLSNIKQWSTGELMYVQDYDEQFTACREWSGSPWTLLVQPYVKNTQIGVCPDSPWQSQQNGTDASFIDTYGNTAYGQTELADYGFAVDYLNIYAGFDQYHVRVFSGIGLASVGRPAQTVMAAEDQGVNFATNFATKPPSRYTDGTLVQVPNASVDGPAAFKSGMPIFYSLGWGNAQASNDTVTWSYDYPGLGGLAPRHRGRATTCFVDGHAKSMTVDQLAAGTNYTPSGIEANCVVTDSALYLWSLQ